MDQLKYLLEQNDKKSMLKLFETNNFSEEEVNLISVAILKDFNKETDLKCVKQILSLKAPSLENSFNLRLRLATLVDKHEIMKLFKFALVNDISIKKRSIVPLINFAIQTKDDDWIKELYQYATLNDIILDQTVF